jgi:hypothetical protein
MFVITRKENEAREDVNPKTDFGSTGNIISRKRKRAAKWVTHISLSHILTFIILRGEKQIKYRNAENNLGSSGLASGKESDGILSMERKYGKSVRRLIKLVCSAYLNPGKFFIVKFLSPLSYTLQSILPGTSNNIISNTLKEDAIRKGKDSPTRNLVLSLSL